jgi:hypothetical protein
MAQHGASGSLTFPGQPTPPELIRHYPDHSILRVYPEQARSNILLSAHFGEGTINTTGGGGGIVSVPRPQKKPVTVWRGPQANYQHEIPLIFDTWGTTVKPIEQELAWLEQVAGVDMFTSQQPPLLILNAGGALPHDVFHSPQLRWVIPEEPVWGEAIRRRDTGERVRQLVTVKFMVWNAADILSRNPTRQTNTKSVYVAKQGDTYTKIAARELKNEGGAKWGNRLAQLNGARDGAASPGVGQSVKLPTSAEVKRWSQTPRR